MESKKSIDEEKLIPSSLFEEDHPEPNPVIKPENFINIIQNSGTEKQINQNGEKNLKDFINFYPNLNFFFESAKNEPKEINENSIFNETEINGLKENKNLDKDSDNIKLKQPIKNEFNGNNIINNNKYNKNDNISNNNFIINDDIFNYFEKNNNLNFKNIILENPLNNNKNGFNKKFNPKVNLINNNINNINNISNINNINNVILTNNFTNFNISSLDENKYPNIFQNLGNDNINMYNFPFKNNQKDDNVHNFNSINIYSTFNNLTKDNDYDNVNNNYNDINNIDDNENPNIYINNLKINLNNSNNNHNNKNNSNNHYKNYKKKNSLFHNDSNKEKNIRDFKRFCEGIKAPLEEYICSQIGSRIMQKYLNRFPTFIITILIEKISLYFQKIICDIYGNYFFQKLYTISTQEQRRMILNYMKDIFIIVSENPAGAHVVQNIIEEAETKNEKDIIMGYVKGKEMEMALHEEGTHVLQKLIQVFLEKERQDLTDVLCTQKNVEKLCQDLKGISVIKRLISFNKEIANRIKLVESFYPNMPIISKSSSGAYIVNYLLEQWGIDIGLKLVNCCINNFETFAINKHSSHLIYKIIIICLKKYLLLLSSGYNININSCKEILIIKALKSKLFEPNKIVNVYENKFGRSLIMKIRCLFSFEENKIFYLFIKSLELSQFHAKNKIFKIYVEIFNSS